MSYKSKYNKFIFESFNFDRDSLILSMNYSFDSEIHFTETIQFFDTTKDYNLEVLDKVCEYVFLVAGTSYYKLFPTKEFDVKDIKLNSKQVDQLNKLYYGGLSQFAYENKLEPSCLAQFNVSTDRHNTLEYSGDGILLMQSGGNGKEFTMFHASTTGKYPKFLDSVGAPMAVAKRTVDIPSIKRELANGGVNGHIPFSGLFAGFALIQAVLLNKSMAIASIETSSEEPNLILDNGFEVNHQYSKKYEIELGLQEYLHSSISENLHYGSILRPFNEVKIGELFAKYSWPKYKDKFSSCNLANYKQGEDDGNLTWDGDCPKCANSFLLFAPFVDKQELINVFNGKNLLQAEDMKETYRELLDLSDVKPMECVGTFEEMQHAYHLALKKDSDFDLGFDVPVPDFDYNILHEHQAIFDDLIDYRSL